MVLITPFRRGLTTPAPYVVQRDISVDAIGPLQPLIYDTSTLLLVSGTISGQELLNPLTTIFTPPPSCLMNIYNISSSLIVAPTQLPECYPSSSYEIFSPGLCPSGYTVGVANIQPVIIEPIVGLVLAPGVALNTASYNETHFACCPSSCGYVVNQPTLATTAIPVSEVTPESTFARTLVNYVSATETQSSGFASLETAEPPSTTNLVTTGMLSLYAPPFYVRYQDSDTYVASIWSSIFESSKSALLASSQGQGGNSTITTLSTSSPTASVAHSEGLSGGKIAGVVIGAISALCILIGVILVWLKKRRSQKLEKETHSGAEGAWAKQELDGTSVHPKELDAEREIKEIYAPASPPVELPGDDVYSVEREEERER
ncbi:uncharacterized protein PV09_05780 [Verruconis gallopava]|uniref:Peptidase A1 domain-containing protein n=1 Tax=Verruconis gallopava TaxID=253628 RepID=A0A0D2A8R0_9PEZI|nr:uncharacterized protein PV09_05780 [Verruconis gallopava]KIW03138.1 hypothetical protein PV09_05780 [Verruconis gallopava]